MNDLRITRHISPLLCSNMYIVLEGGHAIIIDPIPQLGMLGNAKLDLILLTHEHYDHIYGADYWRGATGARILATRACAVGCADSRRNLSRYSHTIAEIVEWAPQGLKPIEEFTCRVDESFEGEFSFSWNGHMVSVFECPGHSAGSCGILIDGGILFSGDSLLADWPTELRFPGGSKSAWEEIGKPRLCALDPDVMVYPGHFEAFKLSDYRFW